VAVAGKDFMVAFEGKSGDEDIRHWYRLAARLQLRADKSGTAPSSFRHFDEGCTPQLSFQKIALFLRLPAP
jgi:hypothetical protein